RLLRDYMEKSKTKVIAHVDGAYSDIANELDIPLTGDNIRSKECLNALLSETSNALEKFGPKKRDMIGPDRNLCDFQFGKGAKEFLFPLGTGENRGRLFFSGSQVAAISRSTGHLALTLEGGRMLKDFGKNRVEISFKPDTSNIFGVGVDAADERIRPGEEVIVIFKDEAIGVGRAVLNGREMERVKKGLSVAMRHRL
ncbi:MAG: PUA domain-containing protein, partial [Candidatus Hydrothermarchaeaceae archaeon]